MDKDFKVVRNFSYLSVKCVHLEQIKKIVIHLQLIASKLWTFMRLITIKYLNRLTALILTKYTVNHFLIQFLPHLLS